MSSDFLSAVNRATQQTAPPAQSREEVEAEVEQRRQGVESADSAARFLSAVQRVANPKSASQDLAVKPAGSQSGFSWRDGKSGQGAASLVSTAKPAPHGEDNTRLTAAEPFDPLPPMKEGEFREMVRASGKQPLHSTAPEKRGFVRSAVGAFGVPSSLAELKSHLLKAVKGEVFGKAGIGWIPGVGQAAIVAEQIKGMGEAQFAQVKRAYDNWEAHGGGENDIFKPDVMFPMLAGMTPIFGPQAAQAYDQYQSGDTAGALGTASAMGAMVLLPKLFKGAKGLRGKGRTAPAEMTPVPEAAPTVAAPDASPLASKGKANVPEWVRSNLDTLTAGAEKSGLADQIEELAAQRLTARRIADRLNMNTPEGRSLIRAVRTKRGIPSLEAGEQATDFEQWLANRQKPSSLKQTGLAELPKTPEIEQGVAALEDRGSKIKTRAAGPKEAITETDTESNAVTINTSKLKGSPEHQARQVEEGVRHEAGHVDLAQDTPAVRKQLGEWIIAEHRADRMSYETASAHLGEIHEDGARKWQDAHPDVAESFVEAATKTGSKYEAPQGFAPVPEATPDSAPTLKPVGENYRAPLSTYTDRLYRETSPRNAEDYLPTGGTLTDLTGKQVYFANSENLARGQGANQGVMLEFDPAAIGGTVNRGKPGWEMAYEKGEAELIGTTNKQEAYRQALKSVTVKAGAAASRSERLRLNRALGELEKRGWQKTVAANGDVAYRRPVAESVASSGPADQATLVSKGKAGLAPEASPPSLEQTAFTPLPDAPEGSGYGAGAMKVGQPANASEMAQLSESIAAQEKGKKAPLLRDLGEKAKATGQSIRERATAAGDYLKRAFEGLRNPLKITDVDRAVGVLGREHQVSAIEVNDFTAAVRRAVPDALRREAVYNYAVAQGDQALLQKWAQASKGRIRKGYELAQTLTDAEKTVADNFKNIFEPLYQEAFHAGVLNSFIDDYVRQWVKKAPKGSSLDKNLARAKAQIDMRLLDPNFKAARQRIFLNPFEGEQAGYEYHKDFAKVLAGYYVGMKRAIASRKFIGDMQAAVASDNRPVTAVAGSGRIITSPEGATDAYIVRPKVKSDMTADYLPVEHPAFKGWKWVQESEEGTPIYMQGEMLVHPEYAKRLRSMFQASGVRNFEVAGLKPFGGLLRVQQELKSSLFAGGFFHHVVEGTHAFGHRVNPFTNLPELKGSDPVLLRGMEAGLQVADFHGQEMFADGLAGPGSLFNKFILDPVTAGKATDYQQWLFGSYIPRLKYKTYLHMLERNTGRFSKTLASDQIELLSARQANAAFGELNYLQMARSKTMQDLSRLFFTAPDFLEARGRFVGQALAPYGAEQRWAIGTLALTQYVTARVFNKAIDNDYHWDRPFSLIAGGREYNFRSVPGDIEHLREDWRGFLSYRLNPFTVGLGSELALGRDPQGRYETAGGAVAVALKRAVPIPLQGVVKGTDESLIQSALKVVGVENWKYRTPDERVALERLKETSPKRDLPPDEQKRADLRRRLESEIQHGADPEAVIKQHDKELSPGDKIDLRKASKQKGGEGAAYVLLANNDLDGFEAAFKAATPERQREVYQPLLRRKLAELSGQGRAGASAKYRLTIDERKRMISRIQQMLGQAKPPQTGQFSPVPQ